MTATVPAPVSADALPSRPDLLSLTTEVLVAHANRGLLRRAAKELDGGAGPVLAGGPDGTVGAEFPDGTRTSFAPGATPTTATCSCGAPGVCRHVLGVVLAYQRAREGTAATPDQAVDWSPGTFTDEALAAAFGPRALASARRALRRGVSVRVLRPTADVPVPRAELPSCTVRFPVPGQTAHALSDATPLRHGEMTVLAVLAFRAADRGHPGVTEVRLALTAEDGPGESAADTPAPGGRGQDASPPEGAETQAGPRRRAQGPEPVSGSEADPELESGTRPRKESADRCTPAAPALGASQAPPAATRRVHAALADAVALAGELLLEGVAHSGPVQAVSFRQVAALLGREGAHWPADAVDELAGQLTAYADRSAQHCAETVAALLTEVYARHRAAAHPGVLGADEGGETPLRRVRLTALGTRVSGTPELPRTQTYFAHPAAGIVVVADQTWAGTEPALTPSSGSPQPAPVLATRRTSGTTLAALACSNLVSENARRTPSRRLVLGRGRLSSTNVTPLGDAWARLPAPLLIRDLTAHAATLRARAPRAVRPRVASESVHVVEVSSIAACTYDPASQRLDALFTDAAGNTARLTAPHNPLAPHALDTLATALAEDGVRHVSGVLDHTDGTPVLQPLAVLTPAGPIVPDLAPPRSPHPPLTVSPAPVSSPTARALTESLAALAAAAHLGLYRLPSSTVTRLTDAATALDHTGLRTAAAGLRIVLTDRTPTAWADARLRLETTAELHSLGSL